MADDKIFPESMFATTERQDRLAQLADRVAAHEVEIRMNAERSKEDRTILTSVNATLGTLVNQVGMVLAEMKRGEQASINYNSRFEALEEWKKNLTAKHSVAGTMAAGFWRLIVGIAAAAAGYVFAVMHGGFGK